MKQTTFNNNNDYTIYHEITVADDISIGHAIKTNHATVMQY